MGIFDRFGISFGKSKQQKKDEQIVAQNTYTTPISDDGSIVIDSTAGVGMYSQYAVDFAGVYKNESDLIDKYRQMALQPEIESAVDDIVSECIIFEDDAKPITLVLDDLQIPENVKKTIIEEFNNLLNLLEFSRKGHDIFRRWYIDGRIYYQVVVDNDKIQEGIKELIPLDSKRIRKVREYIKEPQSNGIEVIKEIKDYYFYEVKNRVGFTSSETAIKFNPEAIVYAHSGLMEPDKKFTVSYLHKAIKPLNQLRMTEDAVVIYRLSRAPERRVFYVDVGNLPKVKAEQYVKGLMTQYKNKLVYDATTGEIKDDRKFMSMLEDFWMPRREGGKGTEIVTLPGGQSLGQMDDVEYFLKKLYKSLNVPISRLEPQTGFTIGRSSEITRDELKFARFLSRLRNQFNSLFIDLLKTQLIAKNILDQDEWKLVKNDIKFKYLQDSAFEELKNMDIFHERLQILNEITPYINIYFSDRYVRTHILQQSEEEQQRQDEEIEETREMMSQRRMLKAAGLTGVSPGQVPGQEQQPNPAEQAVVDSQPDEGPPEESGAP